MTHHVDYQIFLNFEVSHILTDLVCQPLTHLANISKGIRLVGAAEQEVGVWIELFEFVADRA